VPRLRSATIAVALAAIVAGCGGSGHLPVSETSESPLPTSSVRPAATLPARSGLIGAIDSARKVAVCANIQLYATTVEGGLPTGADEAFRAMVMTLRQTPRDPSLLVLVRRWRHWRATLGDTVTARRLTAFCS
jgi:hypothetical protein